MSLKIKDGVKLPTPEENRYVTPRKYPFDSIEVGQSFFVPDKTPDKFATYASRQGRLLDRRFRTQTITMRQDLETDEWEMCKPGSIGAIKGTAVTRVS